MTILGNNSRATNVTVTSGSVSFPAPSNGMVNSISLYLIMGVQNNGTFTVNGRTEGTGGYASYTPMVVFIDLADIGAPLGPYLAGQTITLQFTGGGLNSVELFGASIGALDMWCDFEGDGSAPPSAPAFAPLAVPLSMSSWKITCSPVPGIVNSLVVQRSYDGGSSWSTVGTIIGDGGTITDVGVSRGSLQYAYAAVGTSGTSSLGPAFVCPTPTAPAADTLDTVSMTSWSVTTNIVRGTDSNNVQYEVQRSTDGGATWSTVYTGSPVLTTFGTYLTFTTIDTGVPAGPLAYRSIAQNSVADSISPVTNATAPIAPIGGPTYTEVLD